VAASLQAMVEIQSITASAIFAILVSKGVMSAQEAAGYMADVAKVLERDVKSELGAKAGDMLGSYGKALVAADG
jgi:polyhydroxyalkanoate synthesis regulator phasin